MTYTLLARCPETGALGVGIATYSLAVGGQCPAVAAGVGAITSQAFVNPTLRQSGLRLLGRGRSPADALALLRAEDRDYEYRQVALVDRHGNVACHTGAKTRAWAGHRAGDGFVALGNVLADETVVDAMAQSFARAAGDLADRLVCALEAGRAAGGQATADGPLPERSASLLVQQGDDPPLDLRVDSHPDAVGELRRLLDELRPYLPYYRGRWLDPASAEAQDVFARRLRDGG